MTKRTLSMPVILAAVSARIDRVGRNEFSVGELADDLGVQPSALYNHVDGLDGLKRAVAVHATNSLANHLTDAVVARSGRDAVRAIAHAYRDFAEQHPGLYSAHLLPPADGDVELVEAQRRLVGLFGRVASSTGLVGDDIVHGARALRSAVHGFVALEAVDALTSPVDRVASFDRMVGTLLTTFSD